MGKLVAIPAGDELKLRPEEGGLRNYLAGEPVHAGDLLEVELDDRSWVIGRYEWSFRQQKKPVLYIKDENGFTLEPGMRFRKPERTP